jgi:Uncharacterized protein conserved in bacteria (DUF2255)
MVSRHGGWENEFLAKKRIEKDCLHRRSAHLAVPRGWDDVRTPTWIWSVVVDDSLYVRAYHGTASRWYKAAMQQKRGRITAAGITKDVTFEALDGTINDRIDKRVSCEVQDQPVPSTDDQHAQPFRNGEDRHSVIERM